MKQCRCLFDLFALAMAVFRELFHASGDDSRQLTIDLLGTTSSNDDSSISIPRCLGYTVKVSILNFLYLRNVMLFGDYS